MNKWRPWNDKHGKATDALERLYENLMDSISQTPAKLGKLRGGILSKLNFLKVKREKERERKREQNHVKLHDKISHLVFIFPSEPLLIILHTSPACTIHSLITKRSDKTIRLVK